MKKVQGKRKTAVATIVIVAVLVMLIGMLLLTYSPQNTN